MKPFNLFVYGTLMNPHVFRAVLGKRLVRRADDADNMDSLYPRYAILDDYTKVSPDSTYLYAVPDPHGRIRGYLIGPLPGECMSSLLKFEGRNYSRRRCRVQTKDGAEKAVVFIGNIEAKIDPRDPPSRLHRGDERPRCARSGPQLSDDGDPPGHL